MSQLNVATIQSITSGVPVFKNSSGTEKGQLCKSWVNFDGTDEIGSNLLQIKDSFNVSSVTDNGSGDYFVTFTNPMADKNYAVVLGHSHQSSNTRQVGLTGNTDHTDGDYVTTGYRITIERPDTSFGGGRSNSNRVTAAVFGA
tara:strand:+ start:934 stop:1362 length:429 start_codon:yes stop_codon:yes gene_type:complete